MLSINRLYTHYINVVRSTSVLLNGVTTLSTYSFSTTYPQPIIVELEIPSGTATFTVTGLVSGVTSTSTVTFSGSTILKKQTDKAFDKVLSIAGTTGTALTMTARRMNKSGQPYFMDSTIYSNIPCRFDNVGNGNPTLSQVGIVRPDTVICFLNHDVVEETSILVDDKIQQIGLVNSSTNGKIVTSPFLVKNVNSYNNRSGYIYTELILEKSK